MPFLPKSKASEAAVIIAPSGGFLGLAIEKEGWLDLLYRWLHARAIIKD